jgi:hypothetical protein
MSSVKRLCSPLIGPSHFVPAYPTRSRMGIIARPRATEIVSELEPESKSESESDCGTRSQRKALNERHLSSHVSILILQNLRQLLHRLTSIETRHGANFREDPRKGRGHLIPKTGRGPHCRWRIHYNCRPDGLEGRSLVEVPPGRTEGHHAHGGKRCHR